MVSTNLKNISILVKTRIFPRLQENKQCLKPPPFFFTLTGYWQPPKLSSFFCACKLCEHQACLTTYCTLFVFQLSSQKQTTLHAKIGYQVINSWDFFQTKLHQQKCSYQEVGSNIATITTTATTATTTSSSSTTTTTDWSLWPPRGQAQGRQAQGPEVSPGFSRQQDIL